MSVDTLDEIILSRVLDVPDAADDEDDDATSCDGVAWDDGRDCERVWVRDKENVVDLLDRVLREDDKSTCEGSVASTDDGDVSSCQGVVDEDGSLCVEAEEDDDDDEEEDKEEVFILEEREIYYDAVNEPQIERDVQAILQDFEGDNPEKEQQNSTDDRRKLLLDILEEDDEPQTYCDPAEESSESEEEQGPIFVHEGGLDFDMNEPWQRSMLRELKKKGEEKIASQKASATHTHLFGVGHTQSRDFAVEIAGLDDFTLATDSSSTMPIQSQAIHRPWTYPDDSTLLNGDDEEEEEEEEEHSPQQASEPKYGDRSRNLREGRDPRSNRETMQSKYLQPDPNTINVPRSNREKMEAKLLHEEEYNSPWLEMEPSDIDEHDDMTVSTAVVTSAQSPADACFCMGYNVLDLMVPPTASSTSGTTKTSGKYRRYSRRTSRHSRALGRVDECSHEDSNYSASDHYPALGRKMSRDPDGAYSGHDHFHQYGR